MKYLIYDILFHLFLIITIPWYLFKMIVNGKYRHRLLERFAVYGTKEVTLAQKDKPAVWFHAVSVGETRAVMPLLKRFKEEHPETRIVFSTVTRTGRELAKKEGDGLIDSIIYMPIDLGWVVTRAVNIIRPAIFIIVEKEYWPNIINRIRSSGAPVMVINATISRKSFDRYKRLSFFFADLFKRLSLFCAKRTEDAERVIELGMDKAKVNVTGNIKFDMEEVNAARETAGLAESLAITKDDVVIVAGSTHAGEETIIIDLFKKLTKDYPEIKLLIAPRHPNRFDEVARIIKDAGLKTKRRSLCAGGEDKDAVILLDTVGELFMAYALASVSFVGGSLVSIGGHNLLEPAYHSSPVLYGPHIETCADMAELLEASGGGKVVTDKDDLYNTLLALIANEGLRLKMGKDAKTALEANKGATEKTIRMIEELGVLK
ncbi:MAG: 3-deoxy-D-manno-octulosonic acid transferase [Thermodesulfobacteriota bacterium]